MHEKNLRKNKSSNINFQFQEPGLFISQAYPNLGASPDGVISCNCCGERILEIKCPWTSRERLISEYITKPESCLTYDDSNKIIFKNSHPYMQQIQLQMFVTGRLYCDFEVFLVKESVTIRTMKDVNYENDVVPKRSYFYDEVIVPELFTKNIKIEKTCIELLEGIVTLVEKSEITKKLQDDLTLVVWKKVLVKVSS